MGNVVVHVVQFFSPFFAGVAFHRRFSEVGCEGETVVVSCAEEEEETIRAVRANFGRFSGSVCTRGAEEEEEGEGRAWSVTCMQPKTLRIVKERSVHTREEM